VKATIEERKTTLGCRILEEKRDRKNKDGEVF
jgi:hypothetical protein